MKNENKRCARFERTCRSAFRFHSAKGKHPKIRALAEVLATLASALRALAEVIIFIYICFTANILKTKLRAGQGPLRSAPCHAMPICAKQKSPPIFYTQRCLRATDKKVQVFRGKLGRKSDLCEDHFGTNFATSRAAGAVGFGIFGGRSRSIWRGRHLEKWTLQKFSGPRIHSNMGAKSGTGGRKSRNILSSGRKIGGRRGGDFVFRCREGEYGWKKRWGQKLAWRGMVAIAEDAVPRWPRPYLKFFSKIIFCNFFNIFFFCKILSFFEFGQKLFPARPGNPE